MKTQFQTKEQQVRQLIVDFSNLQTTHSQMMQAGQAIEVEKNNLTAELQKFRAAFQA